MKKMIAILLSVALTAALTVSALAAEPFYINEETSPYDNCQGNRSCPMWYFSDLAGNAWYHDGVHYCLEHMLIVGRTGPEDGSFDPGGSVTRDDLVRTLYRSAIAFGADVTVGEDTNILSYTDIFDVPQNSVAAFQWACGSGLVGAEATALEPNAELTRAELVTILYDFAKWLKMDVSVGEDTNILSYDDAIAIPEGAFEAFQWACGAGVINGVSNTELAPSSGTDRAQLATVLMRVDKVRTAQSAQEDGQRFDPLGAHFAGQWVNELNARCALQITGNGVGPFKVTVCWSNSAFSFTQWEMTAVHEITETGESRLVAQDCVRYDVTYLGENEITYETVEIGAMQLDYSNADGKETICWAYELDAADECTFVRESDQVLNPIRSIPVGAHFAGQWVNELNARCALQIIDNGVGPFKVTVCWSNSAFSFTQWEMTAVHEITETGESRLVAQDCVRYDVTYLGENEITYEAVEIGAMQLDYSNADGKETICWAYELDAADECTFVRESDQVLNPIRSIPEMANSN